MAEKERMVSPAAEEQEDSVDQTLRPQRLDDYVGQSAIKEHLSIMLDATKGRGDALDHVLLVGAPGLGKTTLAHIIANHLGSGFTPTSGPAIDHAGALGALLSGLEQRDVVFVDEIHRMPRAVEEALYPAMEDFFFDVPLGRGASAQTIRMDLPRFTLIAATTRLGLLSKPLRDRFGVVWHLEPYTYEELVSIVRRSAGIVGVALDEEAAGEVARRSRGTPRIANRILRAVRDYAQVRNNGRATIEVTQATLKMIGVDDAGLDHVDRRILEAIIDRFRGGPVGLNAIAAAINEEAQTIEDVYEPYLVQQGFVARTPQGRVAAPRAYEHLGRPLPPGQSAQGRLL